MYSRLLALSICLAATTSACGNQNDELTDSTGQSACAPSLHPLDGTAEGIGILRMLNAESTDLEFLDVTARLNKRAAENLIYHRNGPDGTYIGGTGDDDPFDSLIEVDAVPQVGPKTLEQLLEAALIHDFVPGNRQHLGRFDGIAFTVEEAMLVVDYVNQAPDATAFTDHGINSRSADSMLAALPIHSISHLAAVYWVGPATLETLKSIAAPSSASGRPCQSQSDCPNPLYCEGIPRDPALRYGRCVQTMQIPGQSESCNVDADCQSGLFCAGTTIFNSGSCRPLWMRTTVQSGTYASIPQTVMPEPMRISVVVFGLATVPEDIVVDLDLKHTDPSSLWIGLSDPNGTISILWDGDTQTGPMPRRFFANNGISRDDDVNGRWSLLIQNKHGRGEGELRGYELTVTSRYD